MSDDFRQAAEAALEWIDYVYPPTVFVGGENSDEGVNMIVGIREALRAALAQPPANPTAYGTGDVIARDWDTPEENAAWKHLEDAQPPGGWQPVEGTILCDGDVTIDADRIAITIASGNTAMATAELPPNVRLCEWVGAQPPAGAEEAT